jgi:pentatricopeptide repeat protein
MVIADPESTIAAEPIQPNRNDTATLWSYVSTLQRRRRQDSTSSTSNKDKSKADGTDKNRLLKPAKSLAYFLAHHQIIEQQQQQKGSSLSEPLQRAVVQAIRIASPHNDYRLILNLVDGVWHYCTSQQQQEQAALVDPRIIGEAISGLALTSASIGKIKAVWKVLADYDSKSTSSGNVLTRRIGPREVNAMLTVFGSRGKIRAALDLYRQYASNNRTDAYSLCILVQALTNSIGDGDDTDPTNNSEILQAPENDNDNERWQVLQSSACWQWRETVTILQEIVAVAAHDESSLESLLNNHVLAAVLQLNERASAVFGRQHHHDGAAISVGLLDWMKEYNVSPDVVTCTLLLSSLSTEAKIAVQLLRDMQQQQQQQQQDGSSMALSTSTSWSLPRPNVYSYSAAISACARCREYSTALELLDELRQQHDDLEPNTVVYNAVLQALAQEARAKKKTAIGAGSRLRTVLDLLERMHEDLASGMDTAPDTVTYNTVLAALGGIAAGLDDSDLPSLEEAFPSLVGDASTGWPLEERIAHALLDKMVLELIPRDAITYRHAMLTSGAGGLPSVVRFLDRATKEAKMFSGSIDVFNSGISALGDVGDIEGAIQVLSSALEAGAVPNSDTTLHLIHALGRGRQAVLIPVLLLAVSGNTDAIHHLNKVHGFRIDVRTLSSLVTAHFSAAIAACLLASDFKSARRVLGIMNDFGMRPSNSSLHEIARAYAVVAIERASANSGQPKSRKAPKAPQDDVSTARALNAYAIIRDLDDTPVSLLSLVSKACASAGAFKEAQSLLRRIHLQALERASADSSVGKKRSRERFGSDIAEQVLPGLHRALLRSCAYKGNVTAALWLVDDIQYLSRQLSREEDASTDSILRPAIVGTEGDVFGLPVEGASLMVSKGSIGMKVVEWRSLLIAASKSGHWRVCLSTLQFLRPYLEAVHASLAQTDEERILLQRDYDRIAPASTTVIRCLAARSQYAWCVRSLYDWIEWSGRAPPKGAVLGAVRVLAARGRCQEVNSLLAHCTAPSLSNGTYEYESSLYVGSITTLYNEGLYDDADEAFVAAIARGFLPLSLEKQTFDAEQRITLDLHGMNVAVAHSAVRIGLQQAVLSASWNRSDFWDNDMFIVTGRGRNSALRMRPVLRPEVQRMLVEEFYPPLNTASVPGNMGALRVPSEDIDAWLSHQREQKGARMLTVAAVLKNLSSGNRLRSALSKAAVRSGGEPPRP